MATRLNLPSISWTRIISTRDWNWWVRTIYSGRLNVLVAGNRASMSGTITDSSQPELVGSRSLLVVEDNGQGNKATPDRVTWVVVSAADCHALPPSAYALNDVTDGHIHVKASNVPF